MPQKQQLPTRQDGIRVFRKELFSLGKDSHPLPRLNIFGNRITRIENFDDWHRQEYPEQAYTISPRIEKRLSVGLTTNCKNSQLAQSYPPLEWGLFKYKMTDGKKVDKTQWRTMEPLHPQSYANNH